MIEEIESERETIRKKTNKTIGINIPLLRPDAEDLIRAAADHGADVISTSSGSPGKFTSFIKDKGLKVIHVVSAVTFARKCEQAGVDVGISFEGRAPDIGPFEYTIAPGIRGVPPMLFLLQD